MRILLGLLLLTSTAFGVTRIVTGEAFPGLAYNRNLLLNGDFSAKRAAQNWTVTAGTATLETAINKYEGDQTLRIALSAVTGTVISQSWTPSTDSLEGVQIEASVVIKTSMSNVQVCSLFAGAEKECINVDSSNKWNRYALYISPTSVTNSIGLRVKTSSSSTGNLYMAKAYVGVQHSLMYLQPKQEFSAYVSALGVVSNENENFIEGNCTHSTTGTNACTFVSNKFLVAPNCVLTPVASADKANITGLSVTGATLVTDIDSDSMLQCSRAGSDAQQLAISPRNSNYNWTSYTPTLTGFGTGSAIECLHARDNSDLLLRCKFTSGTSTATEARVSLPNSFVSASGTLIPSIQNVGSYAVSKVGALAGNVLVEPSVGYITLGTQDALTAGLSKANGSSIISSGETISINARIPINGWDVNQNAPLLTNSVVSSLDGVTRFDYANVVYAGGGIYNASLNPGNWISSLVGLATGQVEVNFTTPFAVAPSCTCMAELDGSGGRVCSIRNKTSSQIRLYLEGGSPTNMDFSLHCAGPR